LFIKFIVPILNFENPPVCKFRCNNSRCQIKNSNRW